MGQKPSWIKETKQTFQTMQNDRSQDTNEIAHREDEKEKKKKSERE